MTDVWHHTNPNPKSEIKIENRNKNKIKFIVFDSNIFLYFINRGPKFAWWFMEDLSKVLETKQTLSMTSCPQIDSQIERINQEVKAFL